MSEATLQAVHDAIAAHLEDENQDGPEYLAEWALVATAVLAERSNATAYYYYDSDIPIHHAVGLLHHGLQHLTAPQGDDDD